MIDMQVAVDKLAGFQTCDEIADYLRSEGIVGNVGRHDSCPVALWLGKTTGQTASVAGYIIPGIASITEDKLVNEVIQTPQVIKDFIKKFDSRLYPDLIERKKSNSGL
jgi:hypothetical protein